MALSLRIVISIYRLPRMGRYLGIIARWYILFVYAFERSDVLAIISQYCYPSFFYMLKYTASFSSRPFTEFFASLIYVHSISTRKYCAIYIYCTALYPTATLVILTRPPTPRKVPSKSQRLSNSLIPHIHTPTSQNLSEQTLSRAS